MSKINTIVERYNLSNYALAKLLHCTEGLVRAWKKGAKVSYGWTVALNILDIYLSNAGDQKLRDFCKKMLEIHSSTID